MGKGGTVPRAPNDYGGAESLLGATKNLKMSQGLFSIEYICFRQATGSNMWAPNLLHAQGAI